MIFALHGFMGLPTGIDETNKYTILKKSILAVLGTCSGPWMQYMGIDFFMIISLLRKIGLGQ